MEEVERETENIGNLQELKTDLAKIGEEQKEEELNKEKIDNEAELLDDLIEKLESLHDEIKEVNFDGEIKGQSDLITKAITDEKLLFIDEFQEISKILSNSTEKDSTLMIAKDNLLSELIKLKEEIEKIQTVLKEKHNPIDVAFARLLEEFDQPEAKQIAQKREQLRKLIRKKERARRKKEDAEEN